MAEPPFAPERRVSGVADPRRLARDGRRVGDYHAIGNEPDHSLPNVSHRVGVDAFVRV